MKDDYSKIINLIERTEDMIAQLVMKLPVDEVNRITSIEDVMQKYHKEVDKYCVHLKEIKNIVDKSEYKYEWHIKTETPQIDEELIVELNDGTRFNGHCTYNGDITDSFNNVVTKQCIKQWTYKNGGNKQWHTVTHH